MLSSPSRLTTLSPRTRVIHGFVQVRQSPPSSRPIPVGFDGSFQRCRSGSWLVEDFLRLPRGTAIFFLRLSQFSRLFPRMTACLADRVRGFLFGYWFCSLSESELCWRDCLEEPCRNPS